MRRFHHRDRQHLPAGGAELVRAQGRRGRAGGGLPARRGGCEGGRQEDFRGDQVIELLRRGRQGHQSRSHHRRCRARHSPAARTRADRGARGADARDGNQPRPQRRDRRPLHREVHAQLLRPKADRSGRMGQCRCRYQADDRGQAGRPHRGALGILAQVAGHQRRGLAARRHGRRQACPQSRDQGRGLLRIHRDAVQPVGGLAVGDRAADPGPADAAAG